MTKQQQQHPWLSFVTSCWGSASGGGSSPREAESKPKKKAPPPPSTNSPHRVSYYDLSNSGTSLSAEDLSLSLPGSNLHVFTLAELKAVTRNFSMTNFIGSGGFGPVYKGYVDDKLRPGLPASYVAVKSLDLEGAQGHREWLAEVLFLGQLRHRHVVKLIGYCIEAENRLLVYEYMARGSLENHLFKRLLASLPWSTRIKIAVGAAKGLAFLHEAEQPVIYRDFKASNILLDSDYTAKLSDFGLAKDGPQGDDTHVSTRVMGTHGYAAPEYVMTGHLTKKSDVYSFGVVLLELLSGRRSVDKHRPNREKNLVEWARPYLNNPKKLSRVMDANLEGQYSSKGAQKVATMAHKCLSLNPKSRPSMKDVVEILELILEFNDYMPAEPFVYIAPTTKKESNDREEEIEAKPIATENMSRRDHDQRHKQLFPNSAIHSEVTLRRVGNKNYRNSPRHHQSNKRHE
ncbi:hypothetical protein Cni_G02675 [Canna indica]|uniref:non-specific serine/threonine protein kinase n=1 Tax=Canna indica TaxID=4628 RepID=A0AAQ3JRW0_9LILI|nr:hypothetical protein Cni_G02675 [Canna indica]